MALNFRISTLSLSFSPSLHVPSNTLDQASQKMDMSSIAALSFLVWDILITLDLEVDTSYSKWLYFFARYFAVAMQISLLFVGTELSIRFHYTESDCVKWYIFQEVGTQLLVAVVERATRHGQRVATQHVQGGSRGGTSAPGPQTQYPQGVRWRKSLTPGQGATGQGGSSSTSASGLGAGAGGYGSLFDNTGEGCHPTEAPAERNFSRPARLVMTNEPSTSFRYARWDREGQT
ncbi:hypothetical protein V8E52_010190 [Russula decolorans]